MVTNIVSGMKVIPVLLGFVCCLQVLAASSVAPGSDVFEDFEHLYNKSYTPQERAKRKEIYSGRVETMREWNKLYDQGKVTYSLKTNHLADMTDEELFGLVTPDRVMSSLMSGQNLGAKRRRSRRYSTRGLPKFVDWRESHCVPPVRNQISCGACYAFATLDLITANKCIRKKEYGYSYYDIYSPQYVVDCAGPDPKATRVNGCNGGWPPNLIDWINSKEKIPEETIYPYIGYRQTCKNLTSYLPHISPHYRSLIHEELRTENEMMEHLAVHGPVVVAMNASNKFVLYNSGIFSDRTCGKNIWNHAILIIGYGREAGKDYWLIKNSWGKDWGEDGYGRILRGKRMCRMGDMGWGIVG